jgi:pimeloyl-ACP methyl ester carboxylesterase
MTRTIGRLWIAMLFAAVSALPFVLPVAASSSESMTSGVLGTPIQSFYVRAPRQIPPGRKVQVLLAIHGMGGNGEDFSKDLIESADRYGWLIVAPTIAYGDWTNPDVVAHEDPLLIAALSSYLDHLPELVGMPLRRQVLLLGHSRGAQLAHRFAEFVPERVLAVAAISAGTYTLPETSGPGFPYALQDLAQYTGRDFDPTRFETIPFWVGVGGLDTNAGDVPHQWDSLEGSTRVQRAQAFEAAMLALGANSVLRVFGNTGHGLTPEMRQAACTFLGSAMWNETFTGIPLPQDQAVY